MLRKLRFAFVRWLLDDPMFKELIRRMVQEEVKNILIRQKQDTLNNLRKINGRHQQQ